MKLLLMAALAAALVHPSGPSVPENLLRIEVRFATPLAAAPQPGAVRLLDERGAVIADALLDLPLLDGEGKRLTLLLHPGRIKTGVGPHLALGLALQAGRTVTLALARPGQPALTKTWRVTPAVRQRIDPAAWQLALPAPSTRAVLSATFPHALNTSAAQLIAVADADGRRVAGQARLTQYDTVWQFIPDHAWRAANNQLRIHASLEDPEGNRLCSAFEEARQHALDCTSDARLPFDIADIAP